MTKEIITPTMKHYTYMVDLLGDVGYLVDEKDIINKYVFKIQ